jgi:hypothetical protein
VNPGQASRQHKRPQRSGARACGRRHRQECFQPPEWGAPRERSTARSSAAASDTMMAGQPGEPFTETRFVHARVAKSADAADLKSADPRGLWGFKSPPGHHRDSSLTSASQP